MCGIVGAVSNKNIVPILIEGLKRLEYRGYDSCGIAVRQGNVLKQARSTSRVAELEKQIHQNEIIAETGIAHTRWATHGAPVVSNAHPHLSDDRFALVHNGIIENYIELRDELMKKGYKFKSQTDTEVIVHLVNEYYSGDLLQAVQAVVPHLKGAYAIVVMCLNEPHVLIGARNGSPLVIGFSENGNYFASDSLALSGITNQIMYLEDGDVASLDIKGENVSSREGSLVEKFQSVYRSVQTVQAHYSSDLGPYRHYMQKEIFEQPRAIANTLDGITEITPELFGDDNFNGINSVLILACGTSSYAGLVAKQWIETLAGLPTVLEIASEYRYRDSIPNPRTLVISITQSGETADTLAAIKHAKSLGMKRTLTICNVSTSAMVRECELSYITRAGIEIGVASTKAFTTQLVGLFLLALTLAKQHGRLSQKQENEHLTALRHLPAAVQNVLGLESQIKLWAEEFAKKENALFLARGIHYPIALEGALKLKEITYIHAEAYAAGELKHGPLALVTSAMPVITVAPNDELLEKLKSNMQEVKARGGELFVLADENTHIEKEPGVRVIKMPEHYGLLSPILHVIPLQLLAYHTACIRGTDVDRPRNLAKSVSVE